MRLTVGQSLTVMAVYAISMIFVDGCNRQADNPSNNTPPPSEPAAPDETSAPAADQTGQTELPLGTHGPTSGVLSTLPGGVQQSAHGSLNGIDDLSATRIQGGVAEPQTSILYDPLATDESEIISAGALAPELPALIDLDGGVFEPSVTSPSQVPGTYP